MAHNVWDLEAEQIGQAPGGEWLCPLPSALCPLSLLRTTAALPAAALAACTLQRGHRLVPFPLLVPFQTPFPRSPHREYLCAQQAELDYLSGRHKDTHRNSRLVRPFPRPVPLKQPRLGFKDGPFLTPVPTPRVQIPASELRGLGNGLASFGDKFNLRGCGKPPAPRYRVPTSEGSPPSSLVLEGTVRRVGVRGTCVTRPYFIDLGHPGALRSGGSWDAKKLGWASNPGVWPRGVSPYGPAAF